MNKVIETPTLKMTFISDNIVLVNAHTGVTVDGPVTKSSHQLISESYSGDYGMIVDRAGDYSLSPVEVFQVLNDLPRLKAIAIVVHRDSTKAIAQIDKSLSKKPLQVFDNINNAQTWLNSHLGG